MVAKAEIICEQSIQVVDVQYLAGPRGATGNNYRQIDDILDLSSPSSPIFHLSDSVSSDLLLADSVSCFSSIITCPFCLLLLFSVLLRVSVLIFLHTSSLGVLEELLFLVSVISSIDVNSVDLFMRN